MARPQGHNIETVGHLKTSGVSKGAGSRFYFGYPLAGTPLPISARSARSTPKRHPQPLHLIAHSAHSAGKQDQANPRHRAAMAGSQEATVLPTGADKTLVSTHRDEPQGEPKSLIEGLVASRHGDQTTQTTGSVDTPNHPGNQRPPYSDLLPCKMFCLADRNGPAAKKKKFRAAAERFRGNLAKISQRFRPKTV